MSRRGGGKWPGLVGRKFVNQKSWGAGYKKLQPFNITMLRKWRWRQEKGQNELWQQVLISEYGVGNSVCEKNIGERLGVIERYCRCVRDWDEKCMV